jgi:antitoxin ParD1/3/4
MLNFGKV